MNSILRIYVPSTLNVAAQHPEVLIVILDLTPNISKQSTLHDQIHYSLKAWLDIEFELSLTNESNQAKQSWAQAWTLFVGLYQAHAKLEHSIFAIEPSLNIHYSTKLGSFTALLDSYPSHLLLPFLLFILVNKSFWVLINFKAQVVEEVTTTWDWLISHPLF